MLHLLLHAWEKFKSIGIAHGVDPIKFAALYALHYALLWPTVAWMVVVFRKGNNVGNIMPFALFFLVLPWFYPLFFGRLEWYWKSILVIAMLFIAWHGYHGIQQKLAAERQASAQISDIAAEEAG